MYIGRYWGVSRRASASGMFVSNDIPNFEAFLRKSIYSFTTRLSSSSNKLICAIIILDYEKCDLENMGGKMYV